VARIKESKAGLQDGPLCTVSYIKLLYETLVPESLKVGCRDNFLAYQNQHISKPTRVKLYCNGHSRNALKSMLKFAKLAPSEKRF